MNSFVAAAPAYLQALSTKLKSTCSDRRAIGKNHAGAAILDAIYLNHQRHPRLLGVAPTGL